MDTNSNASGTAPSADEPLNPLQRIFVPIEKRMTNGNLTFKTSDGDAYVRTSDGVIRRKSPKVNGKAAKRERQRCRR